jgi:hypothetical protein
MFLNKISFLDDSFAQNADSRLWDKNKIVFSTSQILSHLIVADINLSQMNDAEMISSEMIFCRNECRVEICRDDFAEIKHSPINGL